TLRTRNNQMIPARESVMSEEILSLLKKYCGERLVSRFISDQKKMAVVEQRLLRRGGPSLKANSALEVFFDSEAVYDQLVTVCKQNLNEYEFQEVMLNFGDVFKSHGELHKAERTYSNVMQYGEKTGHMV